MMELAKVTSKGQVTIPIDIRRKLGVKEGDKITVRYNPAKPEKVTATTKTAGFVRIAFGIVISLAGLVSLVLFIVKGR